MSSPPSLLDLPNELLLAISEDLEDNILPPRRNLHAIDETIHTLNTAPITTLSLACIDLWHYDWALTLPLVTLPALANLAVGAIRPDPRARPHRHPLIHTLDPSWHLPIGGLYAPLRGACFPGSRWCGAAGLYSVLPRREGCEGPAAAVVAGAHPPTQPPCLPPTRSPHWRLCAPSLIALLAAIPHRLSLLVAATPVALLAQLPAYYNRATSVDVESLDPDVASALKHSCDGRHLISHADLPAAWHNNPHISTGYRFIPLSRYPALLYSIFTPHNEFLNIQTHLLPFLLWGATFRASDPAEAVFTACVLICLGSSVVWHTMLGCAHRGTMKFCARVDYVGIGWLISASIGTIVYYGYAAHPHLAYPFLALLSPHGTLAASRFSSRFVFCAAAPVAGLALLYGASAMAAFVAPLLPTLGSCALGVVFYALHVPERFLAPGGRWARRLERIGGGSHAIWHACIVLGIAQWREALSSLFPAHRSHIDLRIRRLPAQHIPILSGTTPYPISHLPISCFEITIPLLPDRVGVTSIEPTVSIYLRLSYLRFRFRIQTVDTFAFEHIDKAILPLPLIWLY
ncbi:hemolysin-III related-domain-containing protein [Mycena olivaceomarginata]|nr:hemolysin-III related-domain-containing protein [Mycena olivaceomarginata]